MKFQRRALDVLETTSHYLRSGALNKTPIWYNVVGANPPFKNHIKTPNHSKKQSIVKENEFIETTEERNSRENKDKFALNGKTGFYRTRIGSGSRSERAFYKPIKMNFFEDELRKLFYEQHPWELADAKVVVEGRKVSDVKKMDWSSIIQLSKKLDGESVVQRTLYLLKEANKNKQKISLEEAYDQARFEYYQVKMQTELETQTAKESAINCGAVFSKSHIEKGFEHENKVLEKWREEAIEETKAYEANMSL